MTPEERAVVCRDMLALGPGRWEGAVLVPTEECFLETVAEAIRLAVAEEREACAVECEQLAKTDTNPTDCAEAIRARGRPS